MALSPFLSTHRLWWQARAEAFYSSPAAGGPSQPHHRRFGGGPEAGGQPCLQGVPAAGGGQLPGPRCTADAARVHAGVRGNGQPPCARGPATKREPLKHLLGVSDSKVWVIAYSSLSAGGFVTILAVGIVEESSLIEARALLGGHLLAKARPLVSN
jgi:hypothetical protein